MKKTVKILLLICFVVLLLPLLSVVDNSIVSQPIEQSVACSPPTYYGENQINFLPAWKNDTFYEQDTVTIKIGCVYNLALKRSFYIRVNITKPDGSKIFIEDYVREYDDPNYYIEVQVQNGENGSWMVDTYTEYKTKVLIFTVRRYNDGTKNFTVNTSSSIPPTPEVIQVLPDNSYFASPNYVIIDEVGSDSTTLAALVKNQTHNKPDMFVRFYVKDVNNDTVWTDSGYTEADGKIATTIPQNTLFDRGDFLVEVFVSKSGIELTNATGVLHVRYEAFPNLFSTFENQYGDNKTCFNKTDTISINWTWSLYSSQPESVSGLIKFIDSNNDLVHAIPVMLDVLADGADFKNVLFDLNVITNEIVDNISVVFETSSFTHNYAMILGEVCINTTVATSEPDLLPVITLSVALSSIALIAGILSVVMYRQRTSTTPSPTPKKKGFAKKVPPSGPAKMSLVQRIKNVKNVKGKIRDKKKKIKIKF